MPKLSNKFSPSQIWIIEEWFLNNILLTVSWPKKWPSCCVVNVILMIQSLKSSNWKACTGLYCKFILENRHFFSIVVADNSPVSSGLKITTCTFCVSDNAADGGSIFEYWDISFPYRRKTLKFSIEVADFFSPSWCRSGWFFSTLSYSSFRHSTVVHSNSIVV